MCKPKRGSPESTPCAICQAREASASAAQRVREIASRVRAPKAEAEGPEEPPTLHFAPAGWP